MHVCIVGTGASGWITAFILNASEHIDKITIIGSPAIPTVGVGESTTALFHVFLKNELSLSQTEAEKFLVDSDAAIKYGVYYQNWSYKNFLHPFTGRINNNLYGYLLGKLNKNVNENHYISHIYDQIVDKNIFIDDPSIQDYSFHIDANKFIQTMENLAKKQSKITYIKDTVINACFESDENVKSVQLESGMTIYADYFVSCVGQREFNERVFKEEYEEYSDVLLTNKAIAYPLKYTNKEKQFHPYTVAKTMNNGWRWITPTWSRIGTGYVFSTNHISVDEAVHEFKTDIGDHTIDPFEVDFFPRRVKKTFKQNYCSIGLAGGFLEPLDAPGLAFTIGLSKIARDLIEKTALNNFKNSDIEFMNSISNYRYKVWCSFILHQYKTSSKNDTQFWKDQKNVNFEFYNELIKHIFDPIAPDSTITYNKPVSGIEPYMFYHTTAGKGLRWSVNSRFEPRKTAIDIDLSTAKTHYEYFKNLHDKYGNNT